MPDITTTQIFSDGEKGITATKMNNIIANSVIDPSFVTSKPSSSTLDPTDQLLEVKGAGTYARITGSQLISSVSAQVDATPQIYSVRLRSFNAVGNPTFEVDQRSCGTLVSNAAGPVIDRWYANRAGTMQASAQQVAQNFSVPGTNFLITSDILRTTVTTAQASLGIGDVWQWYEQIEGPNIRELGGDVTSLSLLVRSSVAGLKFGVSLTDPTSSKSLAKLATIPSANTAILIQLPNIPIMTGGTFSAAPGQVGYVLHICLAAGSNLTAPANDTWQNGNFIGALGQSNFFATVGATFDLAFIQHEPGALCTTPMDCPFTKNLDEDLRYYCKSYQYGSKAGAVTNAGQRTARVSPQFTTNTYDTITFPKIMAKIPTVILYSPDGTANAAQVVGGANVAVNSITYIGENAFSGFAMASAQTANNTMACHYTADTGW